MLKSLSIRNYQSLKKIDLELEKFTVIVGPSSSGKSAVIRALRTLAANSRGGAFLTHGATKAAIMATSDAGQAVYARDGATTSYRTALGAEEAQAHTKLGGGVPEAVETILGTTAQSLAGQFDRPFLLAEPPGEVARVLGEITNVSVIFDAARESNRRKIAANSILKIRERDLSQIMVAVKQFQDLPARIKNLDSAQTFLDEASALEAKSDRLERLIFLIDSREKVLSEMAPVVAVLDLEPLESASARLTRFLALISAISAARKMVETNEKIIFETDLELAYHEVKRDKILAEAGICPMCGQGYEQRFTDD